MTADETRVEEDRNVDFGNQNGHGAASGNAQLKDLLRARPASERAALISAFDQLLQENMARSQELLRQAMTLTSVDHEAEQRRAVERERHQATLVALLDEVQAAEQQAEHLAQSVAGLALSITRLSERVLTELAAAAEPAAATGDAAPTVVASDVTTVSWHDAEPATTAEVAFEAPGWDQPAVAPDAAATEYDVAASSADAVGDAATDDHPLPTFAPEPTDDSWPTVLLDDAFTAAPEGEAAAVDPDLGDAAFIDAVGALADQVALSGDGEADGRTVGTDSLRAPSAVDRPSAFDDLFADPLPTGDGEPFAAADDAWPVATPSAEDLVFAGAGLPVAADAGSEAGFHDGNVASHPTSTWAPWRRDRG